MAGRCLRSLILSDVDDVPLVNADFNGLWSARHLYLGTLGVRWDLERLGLRLQEGLRLRAYDLDEEPAGTPNNLVADGTVTRWDLPGSYHGAWVLALDWLAHESDLRDDSGHWVHRVDWGHEEAVRAAWRAANGITGAPGAYVVGQDGSEDQAR